MSDNLPRNLPRILPRISPNGSSNDANSSTSTNSSAPYGTCPVCGLPLIYSPTRRQVLICSDPMCKYCTPFTEEHAKTTEDLLASRFLADCAIEELYPQYKKR